MKEGVSFAGVVKGGARPDKTYSKDGDKFNWGQQKVTPKQNNVWKGISFIVDKKIFGWLEHSYVGTTYNIEDVFSMQEKLDKGGFLPLKAIPMGGKLVLLTAPERIDESLALWFSEVKPWDSSVVSRERFLWLKVQGVPAHAWEEVCFKTLVNLVGTFVKMDGATSKKSRLDVARILISATSAETIIKNVRVKINEDIFNIRLSEDLCGEVFLPERRINLSGAYSHRSSEESDAFSFEGSWVSETPESGYLNGGNDCGFRHSGGGKISNSAEVQIGFVGRDGDHGAIKSGLGGAVSRRYGNHVGGGSSPRQSMSNISRSVDPIVKRSASWPVSFK